MAAQLTPTPLLPISRTVCLTCRLRLRSARRFRPAAPSISLSSSYHSYEHPIAAPYPAAETAILRSALSHVPVHGFTQASLQLGARDAGYLAVSANLFPRGAFELVAFYLVGRRRELARRVDGAGGDGKHAPGLRRFWEEGRVGAGGRVRDLVRERLRMNVESGVVGRWQQALALMAQPSCVAPSLRELAALADEMWFLAGDASVDTSWYTKRASLAAVYAAAELFQTQDTSEGFRDTERFLDERLQDLKRVGGSASAVSEWLGFTGMSAVNVLRSKGVRW